MKKLERLQKILAQAGIASRRKCEELILAGKVEVNGVPVTTLGAKADPQEDVITVDGKPIQSEVKLYIMLNKPKGVITSASDPQGRKIVSDFLSGIEQRVYPIGRLDYDTEGLLLLTNDGEFANLLTHPKHHVPKTYLATVNGVPHGDKLEQLRQGIELEDGMTSPAEVEYQDVEPDNKESTIRITIYEGRNRQVRRMFEAIGHPVTRLKRVKFGELGLQNLKRGGWRPLTPKEVEELRAEAAKAEGRSSYVAADKPAKKPEWKPKPKPKHLSEDKVRAEVSGRKSSRRKLSPAAKPAGSRSRASYAKSVLAPIIAESEKRSSAAARQQGSSPQNGQARGSKPQGRAASATPNAARNKPRIEQQTQAGRSRVSPSRQPSAEREETAASKWNGLPRSRGAAVVHKAAEGHIMFTNEGRRHL
ncbi:hypothetical protein PCURB6_08620 [Paenibacillus curdlanolyticus]|nr:hypothetical protein PCURB6_08620 [Paenibacillus curdlanolyticus]